MTSTPPEEEHVPRARALIALPNLLTYARLPLAAIIWIAPGDVVFFFTMLGLAALTDMLDGAFARRIRTWRLEQGDDPEAVAETARAGAWLDPFCDKVFFTSALLAVFAMTRMPWWQALLIGSREVLYAPLFLLWRITPRMRAMRADFDFTAGWPGKAATVTQFVALGASILHVAFEVELAILAAVAGVTAVGFYLGRAIEAWHDLPEAAP